MTIPASAIAKLAAIGLTAEQAAAVAEVMEDVETATAAVHEASKAKARERVAKWREKQSGNVTERNATSRNGLRGRDARVEDKTSNLEIEPQKEERNALAREFDLFWAEYPNKVGKPKARESFVKARKRASFDAIADGVRRYVASKPADRAWMNPATFLNQDRWDDQPASVTPQGQGPPAKAPQMADVFAFIGKQDNGRQQERDDSGSLRPAVSDVPAIGSR